jgi:hypothetical protein
MRAVVVIIALLFLVAALVVTTEASCGFGCTTHAEFEEEAAADLQVWLERRAYDNARAAQEAKAALEAENHPRSS